jgi:AGZA family xanthine/uracil permease-like MFS transporter
MLKSYFKLEQVGTNVRTEVLAGFTTFLTMSYIIFVNPLFLSFFGDPNLQSKALPFSASLTATCLSAGLMCIIMGLVTNYPFALAPGMGLNAIVAYQMVLGMGLSWPSAMGVIVLEGGIITVLVITGFREAVMNSIPLSLKRAISVGIGLFIAFIGLVQAGFVQKSDSTLVTLGRLDNLPVVVSIVGLLLTAILMKLKVKGALLIGIVGSTGLAIAINYASGLTAFASPNIAKLPSSLVSMPDFSTMGRFDFRAISQLGVITASILVFSVMLSDFFDTLGTVIGLGGEAKFLDEKGRLPRIGPVLLVDSLAAVAGGASSASSVTTYVESAAGIAVGGRSGLTTVVVGIFFFLAVFLSPVAGVVPKEATAPALIIVGFLMLSIVRELPFDRFEEAFPAFLIMLVMPLTYSISNGIGFGFIAYSLIKLLSGKGREVHWLMYAVSSAFAIDFAIPALKALFGF